MDGYLPIAEHGLIGDLHDQFTQAYQMSWSDFAAAYPHTTVTPLSRGPGRHDRVLRPAARRSRLTPYF